MHMQILECSMLPEPSHYVLCDKFDSTKPQ